MQASADLPDDIESLKNLVIAQRAALTSRDVLIERLRFELARLKRARFGQSSEQLDPKIAQLELTLEELEASEREITEALPPPVSPIIPERAPPARKPLPESLPRETVMHAAACVCSTCGGELRAAGEDVAEMLEVVPARFKVIRHVRPKFACTRCQTLYQAPAPSRPIARGLAGPGLLAHVLVSKYQDHLPLYRQSEIYAREGIELPRSTLADWVGQCSALLRPLVAALGRHVLAGSTLHADDTPVPVLCPGRGTTKHGRLWTYVRDERPCASEVPPAVWFAYSPDRKAQHPREHLKSFRGTLHADGYAGFQSLYDRPEHPLTEAACWAHARRKFFDVQQVTPSPLALHALAHIGQLYGLEEQIRGQPPEVRQAARQARAGPVLEELHRWMQSTLQQLSKKSELAGAIRYSLSRWRALTRYRDDGRLEIDNNAAERALRAVALGRKNYLFAGSDAGGERAAAIYSLLGTAKLNGLDPQAYLRHVLATIADHPITRIADLLPWNLAATLATPAEKIAA
jgi:transposase